VIPFIHSAVVRTAFPALLLSVLGLCAVATAQDESPAPEQTPADAAPPVGQEQPLHILEQALLRDFERFEEKLLELAEYTRRNDPDRAELLIRTRSQSTQRRVQAQMRRIADALAPTESGDVLYGDALARQEELINDLADLLKLLQSEDERDRIDREIARLKELVKETNRLIGRQKDVRADTERRGEPLRLAGDQQRVNDDADALAQKIDRQDSERQAEADRESGEPSPGEPSDLPEGEPTDGEPPDGKPQEGKPRDMPSEADPQEASDGKPSETPQEDSPSEPDEKQPGEQEPGEQKPSDTKPQGSGSGKPQEGDPPESEPSEDQKSQSESPSGQPQQGQPQQQPGEQQPSQSQSPQDQQQTPGREQLEEARERMERAIEELELKRLDKASGEQDAALAKLEEMKAELEEILRQLREEEKKLFLMALEARFQRMLERQLNINNGTLKLDRITAGERDEDRHLAQATQLSRDQSDNAGEADKALLLLREDGSSVAFPEAVEMMRDNMQAVVSRLQRGDTADTTQLLERMVVESLEEIIFALQREMEKQDEQQQQQQQQQQPTDPSLVDQLAELKMIRSLQNQVNRLTRQYGLEIEGEQATTPDDLQFLRSLAGRQQRIQEATYDLSIGKNQ
jgi:hypothetical protein